jgi:DNA-binding transcriptional LysR family regulator
MGLAITADHLVMEEMRSGRLIPIFPSRDKVVNQISLVELRAKDSTLTEREFQLFLEERLRP